MLAHLDSRTDGLRVFPTPMTSKLPPDPALAAVLRRVRDEREETQEDVAFGAGVGTLTVRRAEQGLSAPSWPTVRAIAASLGLSLVDLAREIEREG